jgi:hypothetical protein
MPERMSWAGLARAGADARRAKTPDAICFFTVNFHVIVFLILTAGNGLVTKSNGEVMELDDRQGRRKTPLERLADYSGPVLAAVAVGFAACAVFMFVSLSQM